MHTHFTIRIVAVIVLAVLCHEGIMAQVSPKENAPAPSKEVTPIKPPDASRPLSADEVAILARSEWTTRVGDACAVWVDVDSQRLRWVQAGLVLWEVPCSTARNGIGSEVNSNKTPLGWHAIAEKYGKDAQWGTIFLNTQQTKRVWKPGQTTSEDLILTRVMVLEGLEPGQNKGGSKDSYVRGIYIHGTNDEEHIGTPTSHGCIRLRNDNVIALFDKAREHTLVLVTGSTPPA